MRKNTEQTSLNGLWGWIKKHVHSIAAVATALGFAALAATLETIVAADGGPGEGEDGWKTYEPTGGEKLILDNWAENKFKPYFETLVAKVKAVFETNSFESQINVINDVLKNMSIVTIYYSNNNPEGLSQNGVNIRIELIEIIFAPLKDLIANSLEENISYLEKIDYNINYIESSEFMYLNIPSSSVNYTGEKYIIQGSVSDTPVSSNVNLNSSTSIITPNPINYENQTPTSSTGQNPNSQTGSDNTGNVIKTVGLIAASYFIFRWAFSGDKEKSKEKTNSIESEKIED